MTPEQAVKYLILAKHASWGTADDALPGNLSGDQVDELYDELVERDEHWDAKSEVREGQVETALSCEWSRHYESRAVASQTPDGQWVGWTYWYGGGKHGEPESIDWMEHAYFLDCTETEKVVTVREFSRVDAGDQP